MGEAEHAKQQASQRSRQRHGDQCRFEQIGVAAGDEVLHERATKAARTTDIELSGPATAKGSELRTATIAPPTAADRNVTAMPYDRRCSSGPVKMSAA